MSGTAPVTTYQVRYRVHGTSQWIAFGTPVTDVSEVISNLTPGLTYDVEVLSINPNGAVGSTDVTFTMSTAVPSAPGTPVASNIQTTSLVLNWAQSQTGTPPIEYQVSFRLHNTGAYQVIGLPGLATSLSVTNLIPSTAYDFIVTATNASGSATSQAMTVTTASTGTRPSAPTALNASAIQQNQLTINFTGSTGTAPITYQVSFRPTGSGSFINFGQPTANASITVTGLIAGTAYDFIVTATNSLGSTPSAALTNVSTAVATTPPSQPGLPVVSSITAASVVLTWSGSSGSSPITYQPAVRVGTSGAFANFGPPISATNVTITGLTANTLYNFQVTAINSVGNSASAIASATTSVINIAPSAPTGLVSSSITQTGFHLAWTASAIGTPPINYQPMYRVTGTSTYTNMGNPTTGLSATFSGQSPGTEYDVVVTASNTTGSATSTVLNVTTTAPTVIESPSGTTLTGTTGTIFDAALNAWTLVQSSGSGLQIDENGAPAGATANVTLLLYFSHTVYQQNSAGNWWFWNGSTWVPTTDPRLSESPSGTLVVDTTTQIVDSGGNVWTLVPQSVQSSSFGRDPTLQPFPPTDFWNIGVGSNAQFTTTSDTATAKLITLVGAINSNGNWNQPIYVGVASDPLLTVTASDTSFPCAAQHIHVPIGSAPAGGTDHHMNFFDRTQPNKMFSYFGCVVNNPDVNGGVTSSSTTITATAGSVYDVTASGVYPFGETTFPPQFSGNVGYDNYGAGVIRDWEITAGVIQHALRYSMSPDAVASPGSFFNVGIPWPDYAEDFCGPPVAGTGCPAQLYTGVIPYGSTISIPASVNVEALSITAPGKMLARCIQRYGMIIRDTGGTNQITLYTENVSSGNATAVSQMANDFNTVLVPLLRIMTNQSATGATNVNGGGTYPPTIAAIEATSGSTLNSTTGAIFDATGNEWFISGTQVWHTGAVDSTTSIVALLLYFNHQMYYQKTNGSWFLWSGTAWTASSDPRTSGTVFDDEFVAAPWIAHRTWQAGDLWALIQSQTTDGRGGPAFNESGDQWWTNPNNPNTPISGIYTLVSAGDLRLGLLNTPSGQQAYIDGQAGAHMPYVGALLNTQNTCLRIFGYYEFKMAVQRVPGFSFQFDIENYPVDGVSPPEIDIVLSTDGSNAMHTIFVIEGSPSLVFEFAGNDITQQHVYGLNWQSDFITFYVDGAQIWQQPTPQGTYTNFRQYIFLVTYANFQAGLPTVDPNPASLPAFADLNYMRVYATKP